MSLGSDKDIIEGKTYVREQFITGRILRLWEVNRVHHDVDTVGGFSLCAIPCHFKPLPRF